MAQEIDQVLDFRTRFLLATGIDLEDVDPADVTIGLAEPTENFEVDITHM